MRGAVCFFVAAGMCLGVAQGLTYEEWMAGYPSLSGADAGQLADPDRDGLCNLLEYALAGRSPAVADVGGNVPQLVVGKRVDEGLPLEAAGRIERSPSGLAGVTAGGGYHWGLRWMPRAGTEDVRVSLGYSPKIANLGWWVDGDGVSVMSAPEADGSRVLWHLAVYVMGAEPQSSLFYRLKVKKD